MRETEPPKTADGDSKRSATLEKLLYKFNVYIMDTIYTWFNNYTPKPSTQEKWSTPHTEVRKKTNFDIIYEGIAVDKGSKVETTQTRTHRLTNANATMCSYNKIVRKRNGIYIDRCWKNNLGPQSSLAMWFLLHNALKRKLAAVPWGWRQKSHRWYKETSWVMAISTVVTMIKSQVYP